MKKIVLLALALGTLGLAGCAEDSTDGDTSSQTSSDTDSAIGPSACTQERQDIGTAEVGEPCWELDDCRSGKCEIFRSIPDPGDGVCAEANPTNLLTIQTNVRDLETMDNISGVQVDFGAAFTFSINPAGAEPLVSAISDENGFVQAALDTRACTSDALMLGILARVKKSGYYPSLGGLVAPEVNPAKGIYPSVLRNHDMLVVPEPLLTRWSQLLAGDQELKPYLPLGEKGGCVVVTRHVTDGSGVAGAKLLSNTNPQGSKAILRYLDESGDGFNTTGTGSSGIALVLNPGVGENFDATDLDGKIISHLPGTMGSSPKAIYTNTLHVK